MATNTDADTDWYFDWPSGYVRYKDGRREVWQDSFSKPARPTLTDEEREAVAWFANYGYSPDGVPGRMAATLRGLLERTNPRLAAAQKLTELDEELGLPRTPTPHSNQSEVSVRPTIDSELVQ